MTAQPTTVDQAVIAKHRAMWATGDYPKIAIDLVAPLGPVLVEATHIGPGDRVLDVAAGTGNAAIRAAQAGANVIASDLCPELLQAGAAAAAEQGVQLQWREADAHALPFGDNEFDVVMSCIGVMFAPFHEQSAGELVRVCKPGGRLGLLSWTPEGPHRSALRHHEAVHAAPAARCAAAPAVGQRGPCPRTARRPRHRRRHRAPQLTVDIFADGADSGTTSRTLYGPTIAAYRNIEGDADRVCRAGRRHRTDRRRLLRRLGDTMQWEYLLLTARKA